MKRFLIRLMLVACAFNFLLPTIPGIEFHGNFLHALLAGVLFAFLGWLIELGALAMSAILTISTFGMALFLLIPIWFLGFWLLPAVSLRLVADFMPATLSFSGWLPAIGGGLIMMIIGIITSGDVHEKVRSSKPRTAA